MAKKKLSQKEFEELEKLKQDGVAIASSLGELEYQKISIELQIEAQKESIKELKRRETTFFENIRKNYGNIVLNVDTGEIN